MTTRRGRWRGVALAVVASVGLAGALLALGTGVAKAQTSRPAPDGARLFLTGCATCHGAEGLGTEDGPSLVGVGAAAADFMLRTGRMPLAAPTPQAPSKPVAYDDADIVALVAHVAAFGDGPAIPEVDLDTADMVLGGELYRANCAACHNAAGIGGALSYGREAPSLHHVGPVQIAEAMRIGPGQMPVFDNATFDDHQADSIVKYVRYLAEPESPGGSALGGAGPIPEGFVAVLGGLGVLILLARWITREREEDPVRPYAGGPVGPPDPDATAPAAPAGPPAAPPHAEEPIAHG